MELNEIIEITNHYEDRLRYWEKRYHDCNSSGNRSRVSYYATAVDTFNTLMYRHLRGKWANEDGGHVFRQFND